MGRVENECTAIPKFMINLLEKHMDRMGYLSSLLTTNSSLWRPRLSHRFALIMLVKYTSCLVMIGSLYQIPLVSSLMNSSISCSILSSSWKRSPQGPWWDEYSFYRSNSFVISWYSPRPLVMCFVVFSMNLTPTLVEMILPELVDSLVTLREGV